VRVRAVAPTGTVSPGDLAARLAARAAEEHEANDRVLVLRVWRVCVRVWGTCVPARGARVRGLQAGLYMRCRAVHKPTTCRYAKQERSRGQSGARRHQVSFCLLAFPGPSVLIELARATV